MSDLARPITLRRTARSASSKCRYPRSRAGEVGAVLQTIVSSASGAGAGWLSPRRCDGTRRVGRERGALARRCGRVGSTRANRRTARECQDIRRSGASRRSRPVDRQVAATDGKAARHRDRHSPVTPSLATPPARSGPTHSSRFHGTTHSSSPAVLVEGGRPPPRGLRSTPLCCCTSAQRFPILSVTALIDSGRAWAYVRISMSGL